MKTNRKLNYDLLRVIAMIGVVVTHDNSHFLYIADVNSINFYFLTSYTSVVRFSALIFIMVSGVFLLDPKKELNTKTIFKKYISRAVFSLLIFNTIYLIYYYIVVNNNYDFKFIIKALINFINGNISGTQFWYLYAAILLYLLTPILRIITKNASKREVEYLLLFGTLFTIVIPTITSYWKFKVLNFRYEPFNMGVNFSAGYTLYYFWGYYINNYLDIIACKKKKYVYFLGVLSLIFTIVSGIFVSKRNGNVNLVRNFGYFSLNIFIYTIAIFSFFCSLKLNKIGNALKSLIIYLSSRSFGVYLVHTLLIAIFLNYLPNIYPCVLVPLFSIFITILSLLVVELLMKIPFLKKYILIC